MAKAVDRSANVVPNRDKKIEEKKATPQVESVAALKEEVHKLSLQHAKGQLKNTTQMRVLKARIARLLTQSSMMKFMKKEETK